MSMELTEKAKEKIREFIKQQKEPAGQMLRIFVPPAQSGEYSYQFFLDEKKNVTVIDKVLNIDDLTVAMDEDSFEKLKGARVDWADAISGAGFKVDNPNKPQIDFSKSIEERIQIVFEEDLNPMLASHGGFVELVEVKTPRAFVKFSGGCQGCASSQATLRQGIEVKIKEVAPEILEVIDITDHDAGENPYM